MSLDDYRQDPPGEHWKNPYPARQGQEFCGHCGDDWPCEAVRDEPGTTNEPEPQRVDLDRLGRLRGIGAHETEDLYDWYAQHHEH